MYKNLILSICCLFSMSSVIASDNSDKKNTFRHYAEKGLQLTGAAISAVAGFALCKWEWNSIRTANAAAAPHTNKAYEHLGNWYKKAYPNVVTAGDIDFQGMHSYEGQIFLSNTVNIMRQTDPNNPYFAEMNAAGKYDYGYRPVGTALICVGLMCLSYFLYKQCFSEKNDHDVNKTTQLD
jgi:hypothetical protein